MGGPSLGTYIVAGVECRGREGKRAEEDEGTGDLGRKRSAQGTTPSSHQHDIHISISEEGFCQGHGCAGLSCPCHGLKQAKQEGGNF